MKDADDFNHLAEACRVIKNGDCNCIGEACKVIEDDDYNHLGKARCHRAQHGTANDPRLH